MKLIRSDGKQLVFHLSGRERDLLLQVLQLYPLLPEAYERGEPTPQSPELAESHNLLKDALAEQRRANKQELQKLMDDKARFEQLENGFAFRLSMDQVEWLLQVLNDIRVGSWVILGSPEQMSKSIEQLDPHSIPYFLAMEISGQFESVVLRALMGDGEQ